MVIRKCNICDRRFKKTEHFKRHERSHTKEKPYECNVCHKRFSRSDVLSRHAKGHNGAAATASNGVKNGQPAPTPTPTSDQASIRRPSTLPVESQQYLPGAGAETVNMVQPLPMTPRDMSLPSAAGLPPSSLDFLANVSTHHARAEPEVNPMMIDDQQAAYFGWNEVPTTADTSAYRGPMLDTPNDLMQFWLEPRVDASSHNESISLMPDSGFGLLGENHGAFSERQARPSSDSVGTPKSGSTIPSERFAKVQKCWVAPSNHNGRLINNLWQEVASIDLDNVFALHPGMSFTGSPGVYQGSRHGLDEECRQHLQAMFGYARFTNPHSRVPEHMTYLANASGALVTLPNFPPAEVLDMALDLYFRNFHPLVPFVHIPTFSAKSTSPSVLYSMCLIGMIMLGTKGTTDFVSKNYSFVLEKITAELAQCSLGTESSANTMSTFAAAFLFLNLAAMTGEKEHLEKSQMLYISLISIAQRHGLFTATEGQILDLSFFEGSPDVDVRWKTWSKIESVKRLISGLLLLDSWYSSFLSMSPIIVPDAIQIILPCNESLFQANTSAAWTHQIRSGRRILMPTVVAPSENVEIAALDNPVDDFSMHSVLAMVQLRLSEAYHRLLSNRASYPFAPCHTYAMDGRARCLPSLQLQIASRYSDVLSHLNPNAAVMWHNMCMTLTADTQIFDLAAGRAGPAPAQKALEDIAAWSQTPAARRACLHAAHIYKAMTNRKASDHTMFHSVFSLFSAALVLGLYEFMVPNTEGQRQNSYIELLDDVDWQAVGTEGFTSFMDPRGSQSFAPSDNPAVNFIRNGGVVYLRGVPFQGGYQSARRILLDYAGLLKDAGKWSVRKFSYVLHIMSDVLMDVE